MGCFVYLFLGTTSAITIGPTAILALITSQNTDKGPVFITLLAFISGFIILALGLLKLGVVIDFISGPVISGFTSAAAITIASGQVASIFGLSLKQKSGVTGIVGTWIDIINNFHTYRVNDTVLGIVSIVVLLLLRVSQNH